MHFIFIWSFSVCEWKTWTLLSVIFLPYFHFLDPCCFSYIYVCIFSVSLCVLFILLFFSLQIYLLHCKLLIHFLCKKRRFEMSQSWRLTNRFNFVFQWKILVYSWIFYPPFSFLTPISQSAFSFSHFLHFIFCILVLQLTSLTKLGNGKAHCFFSVFICCSLFSVFIWCYSPAAPAAPTASLSTTFTACAPFNSILSLNRIALYSSRLPFLLQLSLFFSFTFVFLLLFLLPHVQFMHFTDLNFKLTFCAGFISSSNSLFNFVVFVTVDAPHSVIFWVK